MNIKGRVYYTRFQYSHNRMRQHWWWKRAARLRVTFQLNTNYELLSIKNKYYGKPCFKLLCETDRELDSLLNTSSCVILLESSFNGAHIHVIFEHVSGRKIQGILVNS